MNNGNNYQIIIAGAGMVGAALALALGREGFSVALLDHKKPPEYQVGQSYGLRVSALSLASQNILINLGAWDFIASTRISPYREMFVWDAQGDERGIHFDCAQMQYDYLGHIVENDLIQSALLKGLQSLPNVDCYFPAGIANLETGADHITLELDDGSYINGQLLVGADGAGSRVRTLAGLTTRQHSYQQQGVVAVVKPGHPHRATALQRFLPDGPLAFLPLADNLCSIVWSAPEQYARELLAMPDDVFRRTLAEAIEYRLGEILHCGERAAFPLHYQRAERYTAPRIVLVGDAAHVVHPLAGQGVNLGFLDVARLTEVLSEARIHDSDPGLLKPLRRYERSRKTENELMGYALDGIEKLFVSRVEPLVAARNFGLRLVDRTPLLKNFFIRRAAGLTDDAPPLARAPANTSRAAF
jgi:2-octaprenylphenol hydroxylase